MKFIFLTIISGHALSQYSHRSCRLKSTTAVPEPVITLKEAVEVLGIHASEHLGIAYHMRMVNFLVVAWLLEYLALLVSLQLEVGSRQFVNCPFPAVIVGFLHNEILN